MVRAARLPLQDGHVYDNRITFREIESPAKLVFDLGADKYADRDRVPVTTTFDASVVDAN